VFTVPMDRATAVSLGPFIQAAYNQFRRDPLQTNPSVIPDLARGYALVRTIQMSDFIVEPKGVPQFYGFVARGGQPEEQVIAIRGTADIIEWWDNLHFLPVSFDPTVNGGGNVAEGFYDIYKTLSTMDPADSGAAPTNLFDHLDPAVPIVVTGHSLGAALATLLVADMSANRQNLHPEAWTFASPKVGDANFAGTYNAHTTISWRIYNVRDIIPRVPIDPFDDYQHVNTGFAIDSADRTRLSLGCFHDLNTYLNVLSDGAVSLNPGCKP
jgi:predicted lipase